MSLAGQRLLRCPHCISVQPRGGQAAGLALPVGAYTCDLPQGGDKGCGDAGLGKLGDRDFLAVEGGEADQMAAEHFGVDFVADEEALNGAPGVVALPAHLEGPELP